MFKGTIRLNVKITYHSFCLFYFEVLHFEDNSGFLSNVLTLDGSTLVLIKVQIKNF